MKKEILSIDHLISKLQDFKIVMSYMEREDTLRSLKSMEKHTIIFELVDRLSSEINIPEKVKYKLELLKDLKNKK